MSFFLGLSGSSHLLEAAHVNRCRWVSIGIDLGLSTDALSSDGDVLRDAAIVVDLLVSGDVHVWDASRGLSVLRRRSRDR